VSKVVRVANRENTDAVVAALAESTRSGGWSYADEVAVVAGLTVSQVQAALTHLRLEYGAVVSLPISGAHRLNAEGLARYQACDRNYHPARLGEYER